MLPHNWRQNPYSARAGFTLVEMIVVIVISGIIAVILATIIRAPFAGFDAQLQRAELVDVAESALRRMQRDVRAALPNSVRILSSAATTGDVSCSSSGPTVCALEILHATDGGRYRAAPGTGFVAATNIFQFGVAFPPGETDFDVLGPLPNTGNYTVAGSSLVINNQTSSGTQYNAYFGDNRTPLSSITNPTGVTPHISIAGKNFAASLASPRQRFFIVDTPVTYRCNIAAGTLDRYQGYAITVAQTVTPLGGTSARVADLVVGCRFAYQSGTSARAGLVTLALTIQGSNSTEQIRLLHQVHVYNTP